MLEDVGAVFVITAVAQVAANFMQLSSPRQNVFGGCGMFFVEMQWVEEVESCFFDALSLFKQNKINLTWIESFPARTQKMEYIFFVDFEGHQDDPKVKKTINALQQQCEMLTVLGSFPIAPVSGD